MAWALLVVIGKYQVVEDLKGSNESEKVPRFFCARNRTQIFLAHLSSTLLKPMGRMGYNAALKIEMKKFVVVLILSLFSFSLSAQDTQKTKAWDLLPGIAPIGVGYQWVADVGSSVHLLSGINFSAWSNDGESMGGISIHYLFDPIAAMDGDFGEGMRQIYLLINGAKILNYGRRVQFPLTYAWGLGYACDNYSPLWYWAWDLRIDMKVYFTRRFGMFIGAEAMAGVGFGSHKIGITANAQALIGFVITVGK